MKGILHGAVRTDSILFTGRSDAEELSRLEEVLQRLKATKLSRSLKIYLVP